MKKLTGKGKHTIKVGNHLHTRLVWTLKDKSSKISIKHTHEKMLNITNYQGNANQNHNEISPHTCQNGHNQKEHT